MHDIQILTFDEKTDRKAIQTFCDRWGDTHCDLEERGGVTGIGLGSPIRFADDKLFDNFNEAESWLNSHCGHYEQYAVRYYDYPELKETKAMEDLTRRMKEAKERIAKYNEPHYATVKQSTVKCKACGSSLATKYCGKSYRNNCPVCNADLRPETTLNALARANEVLGDLNGKYAVEVKKLQEKNKKQAKIKWAVCCEVHC